MKITALGLLLVGVFSRYAWKMAPEWAQADVWNVHQALFVMVLLGAFAVAYRRFPRLVLVCCYLAVLQALTVTCSIMWLYEPWAVEPGQDQCDARFRTPLALMGLYIALTILVAIRSQRGKSQQL